MSFLEDKEVLVRYWRNEKVITNQRLLTAFLKIPREHFVLAEYRDESYHDHPLPTIENQTISQPTTVMVMTENLELMPKDHVLEIGAGSGYQAALISELVGKDGSVVTTEIDKDITILAHKNLKDYENVTSILVDDQTIGYPARAPYDKIIVTAALPEIPSELYEQLKDGGKIVAPVGTQYSQELLAITKIRKNKYNIEKLGMYQFVPVRGRFGFAD